MVNQSITWGGRFYTKRRSYIVENIKKEWKLKQLFRRGKKMTVHLDGTKKNKNHFQLLLSIKT